LGLRFLTPVVALLFICCSGPASPTLFSAAPSCPSGGESGEIAPGETVEAFAFELSAGDRVVVEFETDRPGDLVAGLAGPYLTKDKATFAAQTVNEYSTEEVGTDGTTVVLPPRIDLPVHQDGRYGVVVSSTAASGRLSWSACATVQRAAGEASE
jgi:hypothetical protein